MLVLNEKTGFLESKGINLSLQGQRDFYAKIKAAQKRDYDFSLLFEMTSKKDNAKQ
ncbi:MAG: hypothetical protein LBL86_12680 [Coriobacteriales bacterium]|jgi:hypothetical protein|nr:hypothetical protein [Coriobacteriales bacterium]